MQTAQVKPQERQLTHAALDLSGRKFGKLTVLGPSGRYYCGSPVWRCRCSCGNITSVWTKYLLNGTAASCPFCGDEKQPDLEEEYSENPYPDKVPRKPELTVSEYCDSWLEKQKEKLSSLTYKRYRYTVDNHIKPVLGVYLPSQLSKDKINLLIKEMQETLSVSTMRTTLSILHTLFVYIDREAPGQLPDLAIAYPQYEKEKLSPEKQITILEALTADMDTFKLGVFLALMTSMSVGELCALRWKDISFPWRQISVAHSLHVVKAEEGPHKKQLKLEPAKRSPEEQVIQMTRMTSAYCKKFIPEDKDAYLLTGTEEPMPPWTVNYRFKKFMKECGLPDVRFDDLHGGFPEADIDTDFDDERLNGILKKNLEKKSTM